jgi:GTP cyclohydrolase I
MKERLNAESAHVEVKFPYFISKEAPVSKTESFLEYHCAFNGEMDGNGIMKDFTVTISVPVMTLCPCSKEISEQGAHNQRGIVTVKVRFRKFFWIEDLIKIVEKSASSEVYSILKRPDEKYVTEKAYNNPMFVEDVVRNVADKLQKDPNIIWFSVESENIESIHNHNAYAFVEKYRG